jgi:cytochrome c-type biogenesis protein CcmH/NrfF
VSAGPELLLAHPGHWLESVLIAAPVLLLIVGLAVFALVERRRRGDAAEQR